MGLGSQGRDSGHCGSTCQGARGHRATARNGLQLKPSRGNEAAGRAALWGTLKHQAPTQVQVQS